MHVKYVSSSSPVLAQVINDFALLMSGSPLSALSASCDKANSILISTVAPGWTLVDQSAPQGCVISAPDADGLTTKYARIYSVGSSYIDVMGYENWNPITHTGTNPTLNLGGTNIDPGWTINTVNTFWIFATPRSFYISDITTKGAGLFEFTRECEYLKGTTYPCFITSSFHGIHSNGGQTAFISGQLGAPSFMPRMKNLGASGDIMAAADIISTASITVKNFHTGSVTYVTVGAPVAALRNANDVLYHEVRPIWISTCNRSTTPVGYGYGRQVIIGRLYDIQEITIGAGNSFDTLQIDGAQHMIFNASTIGWVTLGAFILKVA